MIEEILRTEPVYFLVDLRIKPINNIKVFLDGDSGITIEKCVQVNRKLYKKLEEAALFPEGDFSLEVSSAGLDEPLKSLRQYKKNIGRPVEVQLLDGTQKEGVLTGVNGRWNCAGSSHRQAFQRKIAVPGKKKSVHIVFYSTI